MNKIVYNISKSCEDKIIRVSWNDSFDESLEKIIYSEKENWKNSFKLFQRHTKLTWLGGDFILLEIVQVTNVSSYKLNDASTTLIDLTNLNS